MRYYQAQDTFVAGMPGGAEQLVTKGMTLPETHELVKRDLDAAKGNAARVPLFSPLDDGEAVPAVKPARTARKAAGNG